MESFYKNILDGEVYSGTLVINVGINLTDIATADGESVIIMLNKV